MPRLSEESYGTGDQSWLGSTHALHNARTVAPDPEAFNTEDFPDGVPSGTPIAVVANFAVPHDSDGSDGSEVLVGFLATDQKAPGEGGWPLVWHGLIKVDRLPVAFDPAGIDTTGQFTFINTSEEAS